MDLSLQLLSAMVGLNTLQHESSVGHVCSSVPSIEKIKSYKIQPIHRLPMKRKKGLRHKKKGVPPQSHCSSASVSVLPQVVVDAGTKQPPFSEITVEMLSTVGESWSMGGVARHAESKQASVKVHQYMDIVLTKRNAD